MEWSLALDDLGGGLGLAGSEGEAAVFHHPAQVPQKTPVLLSVFVLVLEGQFYNIKAL